jgi:hypothetical protein
MDTEKQTVNNENVEKIVSDEDLAEIKSAIKEITGDVSTLFSALLKRATGKETPKSLEQMGRYYEKACDLLIIEAQKSEFLNYISGKLNIELIDDIHFACSTELYFQDANEQWKVKKVSSGQMLMRPHLTLDALNELKKCKKVSFEILEP